MGAHWHRFQRIILKDKHNSCTIARDSSGAPPRCTKSFKQQNNTTAPSIGVNKAPHHRQNPGRN
eukprot:scaffold10060_cov135-Skeletonema_marinoi.AAC.5